MLQRFAAVLFLFLICSVTLLPCESFVASVEEDEVLYSPIPRVPRDGPFGKDPVAPEGRMVSSKERVGSLLSWSPERGPESGSDFRPGAPPSFLLRDLKGRVDLLDFDAY